MGPSRERNKAVEVKRKPITIAFGDVFEPYPEYRLGNSLYIVLDAETLATAAIGRAKDGRDVLSIAGTAGPEYVKRVVDRWGLDRVVGAFRNTFQWLSEGELEESFFRHLRESVQKEPRVLPRRR